MTKTTRRQFVQQTTAAAALATSLHAAGRPALASKNPLEKLNIACIGTANRAAADIEGVMTDNIVAICDVDSVYMERSKKMLKEKLGQEPETFADMPNSYLGMDKLSYASSDPGLGDVLREMGLMADSAADADD